MELQIVDCRLQIILGLLPDFVSRIRYYNDLSFAPG
jgi:hypothetical protein